MRLTYELKKTVLRKHFSLKQSYHAHLVHSLYTEMKKEIFEWISYNLSLIDMSFALCSRSLAPFYVLTYCNKMGQDFLVIQYM